MPTIFDPFFPILTLTLNRDQHQCLSDFLLFGLFIAHQKPPICSVTYPANIHPQEVCQVRGKVVSQSLNELLNCFISFRSEEDNNVDFYSLFSHTFACFYLFV